MISAIGARGGDRLRVEAVSSGTVDLSRLRSVSQNTTFAVQSSGVMDLSSLEQVSGNVVFEVNDDGTLLLGDIGLTSDSQFSFNHATATVDVGGTLYLAGNSSLQAAAGARVELTGDFLFTLTDETRIGVDDAILAFDGSDVQFLEAGSEDLGTSGSTSGNFGVGRIEVGTVTQTTTVMALDLFDNGNRAGGLEGIYLFGTAGLDGLEIAENSKFVLNDINVYAFMDGAMVHLNALFGDEILGIPMGGGGILALRPTDPADFDFDGHVDGDDFLIWQGHFGIAAGGSVFDGDADGDGDVDGEDFLVWQQSFLTGGRAAAGVRAVPEPAAWFALGCAAACLTLIRRHSVTMRP